MVSGRDGAHAGSIDLGDTLVDGGLRAGWLVSGSEVPALGQGRGDVEVGRAWVAGRGSDAVREVEGGWGGTRCRRQVVRVSESAAPVAEVAG